MNEVISFRVKRELKEKMERLRHINWSEVVRRAIEETIKREESRLKERDRARMRAAALRTGQLRRRIPGWSEGDKIVADAPVVIRWFIEEGYSKEALIKEADLYTADEKLLMKTFEGDRDKSLNSLSKQNRGGN